MVRPPRAQRFAAHGAGGKALRGRAALLLVVVVGTGVGAIKRHRGMGREPGAQRLELKVSFLDLSDMRAKSFVAAKKQKPGIVSASHGYHNSGLFFMGLRGFGYG